jgi:uncharacterized glyoxalase superfamily protein PhnB
MVVRPAAVTGATEAGQRIVPMLAYADAPAALDFLCEAFGFEVRFRMDMPDGTVGHAEVGYRGNVVMLASAWREGGLASPRELADVHAQVYCRVDDVDDVDAHWVRARAAGATLVGEPEDQRHGERSYRALDPEGHRWIFATPLGGAAPQGPPPVAEGTRP